MIDLDNYIPLSREHLSIEYSHGNLFIIHRYRYKRFKSVEFEYHFN